MAYKVTLIPGDGIGPEVSEAARRVLEATGVAFEWEYAYAGAEVMEKEGTPLPEKVLDSIRENKLALKGPVTTPVGTGFRSVNVALRKELDLYACVRPCKKYQGVPSRFEKADIVIVRENTEDLYAGIEFEKGTPEAARLIDFIAEVKGAVIGKDAGISIKPITVSRTRRIVEYAFNYARKYGRKKVTAVQKANIMKYSDGLFLHVAREVAAENSDIEFGEVLVDNFCMQVVKDPCQFDVLVAPNLYGDIISDLCAGIVGGLGVAPGANIGTDYAVFEATHGSAPKYAGMNKTNPMAMMLSGVMLLQHIGELDAAKRLDAAIASVIAEGKNVTYDLKPRGEADKAVGTSDVADAVIACLEGE